MNALLRALHAEALKLRGTLALALCAVIPLAVVLLNVLLLGSRGLGSALDYDPQLAWAKWLRGNAALWGLLMLPLLVTLQSALLAQLEHANRQWKHLAALPVPRHVHYLAKWIVLAAIICLTTLLLFLLSVGAGLLLHALRPVINLAGPIPWTRVAEYWVGMWVPSLLIVGIHTWIASRWQSFTVAVSVGMVATVACFLIAQSQRYGHFFPWAMPAHVAGPDPQHVGFVMLAGGIGGGVVLALGALAFGRREFE